MNFLKLISISIATILVVGCGQMSKTRSALVAANNGTFTKGDDRPACEINEVEYLLDTKMVAFELTNSGGFHVGFNLLSGFLQLVSLEFKAKSGSMAMAMDLYDPMMLNKQLASVVGKGTFVSFGTSVNLGFQNIGAGFDFYHQTPLAKLAEKSLSDTFTNLNSEIVKLQAPWSTEVVAIPNDEEVVVPVGSFAGLKVGDIFAIYNVDHIWSGEACTSRYLMAHKSPDRPVAYGEVTDLENNAAVLRLLENETYHRYDGVFLRKGSKVQVEKLVGSSRNLYRTMQIRNVIGAELSYEGGNTVDISPHLKDQIDGVAHKFGFMVYKP